MKSLVTFLAYLMLYISFQDVLSKKSIHTISNRYFTNNLNLAISSKH